MERLIKLALLGKNLAHSISPELHNLIFPILTKKYFPELENCQLDYQKIECESECDIAQWLKTAGANGYCGANVTIPYKEVAANVLPFLTGIAKDSGSVNTIRILQDGAFGASTDGIGLLNAIKREWMTPDLSNLDWFVFGSGGAARACLFSMLATITPHSLTIASRNIVKANALLEDLQMLQRGMDSNVVNFGDTLSRDRSRSMLVLQTTPLGQKGSIVETGVPINLREGDFAIDLVFNPVETLFVTNAKRSGAKAMGGLGMLIEQAALSQYFWFRSRCTDEMLLYDEEYADIKSAVTKLLS